MDCLFCKIAGGEIPSKGVYRDETVLAIEDINPQAPTHLLVMPVVHHANIGELSDAADGPLLAKLFEVATKLGRERGPGGYRLVMNTGKDGGQTVDHLHVHVLAGRHMTWPPG
ncbi:MAG TPA: histidine triad nucleotide-binding protein [Candidatus Acidoferrales bacterium]|nr:histidine triad nucleotide-binding protein [Candidatus Acidoferrales bacterium]